MTLRTEVAQIIDHGGSLDRARMRFPDAPEPWVDLSTGINPHAYPQLDLPRDIFTRLPEPLRSTELCRVAARNYHAPSPANVVAAPGTQILLPRVMSLVKPGRALVLAPTYAEHIRAAAIAGHRSNYVGTFEALFDADLAVVVNPNNPDGRIVERAKLRELAYHMQSKGGLLVVDEAFMDVGPQEASLASEVEACRAIVLRSFGKFFGLAGIRLGFALAPQDLAQRLDDELGPWAVSGPAMEIGIAALSDEVWQNKMRRRLSEEVGQLDRILGRAGLSPIGGTSLFRFVETQFAKAIFDALGRAGILVRGFQDLPSALRFGLPASMGDLRRLDLALQKIATRRDSGVAAE
ncbi:MAG: threonine-phosphate decarboxylase CobD [Rhizobiaceae bacterium]|nr:threonine-phosphate decarboxylase CobD [Rhizobiaceae bacterium]